MQGPARPAVPVICRVALPAPWLDIAKAQSGASAKIAERLAPLFEPLSLPVWPLIKFAPSAAHGGPWGVVAPITVGGKSVFARLPREGEGSAELEAALAQALAAAPDFFVTPDVVDAIAPGLPIAGARRSQLTAQLSELARRGLSLLYVKDVPAGNPPADSGISQRDCAIRVHRRDPDHDPKSKTDTDALANLLEKMCDGLFYELGLLVPNIEFVSDRRLRPHEFRVQINELMLPIEQGLRDADMLINDTPDRLRLIGVEARPAINPANGNACAIAPASDANIAACKNSERTWWGPAGYLILSLDAAVRKRSGSLLTVESVEAGLFLLGEASFPDLVAAARARIPLPRLTQVLRHLLDEEICIRDLRAILEALLALEDTTSQDQRKLKVFLPSAGSVVPWPERRPIDELEPFVLGDAVRIALKRAISHKYTRGNSTLIACVLDPKVEEAVEAQPPLDAGPELQSRLFAAMWPEVGVTPHKTSAVARIAPPAEEATIHVN